MLVTSGVNASKNNVEPIGANIGHKTHRNSDTDNSIQIDNFPTISITKISKDRSTSQFDNNIKNNNKCIIKVFYLLFSIDLILFLKEVWL